MADFIDPFETQSPQGASGFVDPFDSPEPEEPKEDYSFTSVLKDVGRLFVSPATTGINAIGAGIGEDAAGGSFVQGLEEGAKSDKFLGAKLSMDSTPGKWVEEKLGDILGAVRDTSGEAGVNALTNKGVRSVLKGFGLPSLALEAYDLAPKDVKTQVEALTSAGTSATPEIGLLLLGGSKAKGISKKTGSLTEADILASMEETVKPNVADDGVDFTKESITPKEFVEPEFMEGNGIDFEQVKPEDLRTTQGELDFKEPVKSLDFETIDTTPEVDEPVSNLDSLPAQFDLPGINVPIGQKASAKGQRGSVNLFGKKEYTPEQKAKNLNIEEFTQDFLQRHPQYADRPEVATQVYQRLNNPIEASPSISKAVENSTTLKALDYGAGIMSTRVDNINAPIMHRLMRYEKGLLKETYSKIGEVDTFLNDLNKLPKNVQGLVNNLLLNNNTEGLSRVAKSINRPDLVEKYGNVRKVLNDVGNDLKSIGRLEELRQDYFPRMVKDIEGLKATLGSAVKDALETRLEEARASAMKKGHPFGPIEESRILDSFLRGNTTLRGKPGFTKERRIDDVSPDLEKFYHTPSDTLHTYLRNAVQEVETARLFGKDAVRDDSGRVNVEDSIGTLVQNKLRTKEIKPEQARELESILRSRMGPGNMASNKRLQDIKNIANMGLLGNVFSAIVQGGDIIASSYLNGYRPTLMAVGAQVANKLGIKQNLLSMKDFGLIDHVSEEFVSSRSTAKALNKVFKYSGFSGMDAIGKTTVLNGAMFNGRRMVKTPAGRQAFASRWERRFGDEFPRLVKDLQEGKVTELTDMYAFSTLAKAQPVTKMELPQMYADLPNGRVIYMLKSFMLKQMDLYRNDAYNKIFKEGKKREGLTNLARLTMTLGIAGATTEWVKDYLLSFLDGREVQTDPVKFLTSDVPMNVFKTFGWSEYAMNKAKTGAVGEAVGGVVAPPYKIFDTLFKDSIAEMDGDDDTESSQKSLNYLPVVGRILYQLSEKGQQATERKLQKEEDKE